MNKRQIEREIQKIYNRVFRRVMRRMSTRRYLRSSDDKIKDVILNLENSKFYNEFSKRFAKALARQGLADSRGVWRKYFEAAKLSQQGVIHKTFSEFQKAQLYKAVQHNFTMIKSIPKHILAVYERKYIKALKEQVLEGTATRGSFERELREAGHKNSKLIARTETAKLQTAITENRSTDLGSPAYIWRSSSDGRTRTSHRNMNSVVVFWRKSDAEKPNLDNMWGNAGEFPNCRCSPMPIFDEKDLTQASYKVYNYKTHKIITMNRRDLDEALKNKKL